jgi:hypothetical protein
MIIMVPTSPTAWDKRELEEYAFALLSPDVLDASLGDEVVTAFVLEGSTVVALDVVELLVGAAVDGASVATVGELVDDGDALVGLATDVLFGAMGGILLVG